MNDIQPSGAPAPPPLTTRWASRIVALSPHFAVVSALTIIIAVFCSTVFLYGYLSVFDWHLIWIIEYSDVLKFGLVVVAIISGFIVYINMITDDVLVWMNAEPSQYQMARKLTIAFAFIWFASYVTADETSKTPYWGLHLHLFLAAFTLAIVTFKTIDLSRRQTALETRDILNE